MPVLQRHFIKMYAKGQAHTKLQGRVSKRWTHQKVQDTTSSPIPGFLHKLEFLSLYQKEFGSL